LTGPESEKFPFQKVTVITPNHHEAALPMGRWIQTEEDLVSVGRQLLGQLQAKSVLITGGKG
jgi:D-beta-D-heptose 7-phosphate kinase/D-beta-D-heptose 1-phosphate adenosyltransferase